MPTKTKTKPFGQLVPSVDDLKPVMLPVKSIRRSPFQTRQGTSQAIIESVKQDGLQEPPTVRPLDPPDGAYSYEMVKGHQRLDSVIANKGKEIPCVVRQLEDEDAYRLCLIENMQRQQLNPLEEAQAFAIARDRFQWTQKRIAQAFGRTDEYVKARLDLLTMPDLVHPYLRAGISPAKVQALAPLAQVPDRLKKVEADDLDRLTIREIAEQVDRFFLKNAGAIIGWDKTICQKRKCYAEHKITTEAGKWTKPTEWCTDRSHALSMIVKANESKLEGALARLRKDQPDGYTDDLPVFYSLSDLYTWEYWPGRDIGVEPKYPKETPAPPFGRFETYTYSHTASGSIVRLQAFKTEVKDYAGCLKCPALKGKANRGPARAIVVYATNDHRSNYQVKIETAVVCMSSSCRSSKWKHHDYNARYGNKKTPDQKARQNLREAKKAAVNAAMRPIVKEYRNRLRRDLPRLAASVLGRHNVEYPTHFKIAGGYHAERNGIKHSIHSKEPDQFVNLLAAGQDRILDMLADYVMEDLDVGVVRPWNASDHPDEETFYYRPAKIEATVKLLFGTEEAEKVHKVWKDTEAEVTKRHKKPKVKK